MMPTLNNPSRIVEKFLRPGEWWVGDEHTRIRTILGSCVAVTLWHPHWRIGGMCHYMLPGRVRDAMEQEDGRFGDEALELLVKEMWMARSKPQEYEAKLFGGGHMFRQAFCHDERCAAQVSERNAAAGHELMQRHGFVVKAEQLGGYGHRQVMFDIGSGNVWVKRTQLPEAAHSSIAIHVK